ncbi:Ribonuclease 3 [Porphyridium purpureum]|uniref:Ribonuclease 3 n=1 Tax=Porphyridium purpureum TaxID=35688 RepID=A0A5J4YWR8_PORPP|nr:Ribonuclease 3 [Porphyridium purpureum]|eukprot:POR3121..scf209_3
MRQTWPVLKRSHVFWCSSPNGYSRWRGKASRRGIRFYTSFKFPRKPDLVPLDWSSIMSEFGEEREFIIQFESRLGVKFHRRELLFEAFTHRSVWDLEVWQNVIPHERQSYENLECMGDAILRAAVLNELFEHGSKCISSSDKDHWLFFNPSWLTTNLGQLVQAATLADVGSDLELARGIMVKPHIMNDTRGTKQKIIRDVLEAVVGALHLDQGFDVTKRVVGQWMKERVSTLPLDVQDTVTDPKGLVLEIFGQDAVKWFVARVGGPDHEPFFGAHLRLDGEEVAVGVGKSKLKAQEVAAMSLLQDRAKQGWEKEFKPKLPHEMQKHPVAFVNSFFAKQYAGQMPKYVCLGKSGDPRIPTFSVSVQMMGTEIARGSASSKHKAKVEAALEVARGLHQHGPDWISSKLDEKPIPTSKQHP